MNDAMAYVGLANIFEKKQCTIDGKKQIYYEKLDSCFGFNYNFKNYGKEFVALTGKIAGETIGSDSVYKYDDFKTLDELCAENNSTYNYNTFKNMCTYRDFIGYYFTLV